MIFREPMMAMFNTNPEVIKWGIVRFWISLPLQWACAVMEIETGALRGLGCSIGPTIIMIFGVCVFRIVWLVTVFKIFHTYAVLMWSFPLSWVLVMVIAGFYLHYLLKKYPAGNLKQA